MNQAVLIAHNNTTFTIPSQFDKLVMWVLLLSPILQAYGWGRWDFAFIPTIVLSVIYILFNRKRHLKMPFQLSLFFVYWYISHLLSLTSFSECIHLGIIRLFLSYIMFFDCIEVNYFYRVYKRISVVCIAYFIVQYIFLKLAGIVIPNMIPFLPNTITDNMAVYLSETERCCSLFHEPAVFVQYLLPLLPIEFYKGKRFSAFVIVIILLLTQTGNAVVGLAAFGGYYLYGLMKRTGFKRWPVFVAVSVVLAFSLYLYINSSVGKALIKRQNTVDYNQIEEVGYAGSGFVRVYQGFLTYGEYSPVYKFLGNDHEEYIVNAAYHNSIIQLLYRNSDFLYYFNTISTVLLYTGAIGLFLFLWFFLRAWRETNEMGRSILLIILALSFVSANYFSYTMAIGVIYSYLLNKHISVH